MHAVEMHGLASRAVCEKKRESPREKKRPRLHRRTCDQPGSDWKRSAEKTKKGQLDGIGNEDTTQLSRARDALAYLLFLQNPISVHTA